MDPDHRRRLCRKNHFSTDVAGCAFLVQNKVRMHFVGAEFCKVKPTFRVSRDPASGRVTFAAAVKVYALLPPPLDKICEGFMERVCASELGAYIGQLQKATSPPEEHAS